MTAMSTRTMRAYVLTGPGEGEVQDVPAPVAALGEVVVDVERVGVCGTDVEFFTGEMAYLHQGYASYPMRLGHEWAGTVASVGNGVDPAWLGRRVMGDTMLGDGVCRRCRKGYQHVCENRQEVGVRGGRPGALAEQLAVPVTSLHALPDSVDSVLGALVEPGGNALRAAQAAALAPGDRALVLGLGTIGLLVAMFARAAGAEVHLMGRSEESLAYARSLGFEHVWTAENLPSLPFDAVTDASNAPHICLLRGLDPGTATMHVMLICLTVVYRDNPVLVGGLANAWDQLSRACHHHAYELTPTTAEVRHLISRLRGAESILAHDHVALRPASG